MGVSRSFATLAGRTKNASSSSPAPSTSASSSAAAGDPYAPIPPTLTHTETGLWIDKSQSTDPASLFFPASLSHGSCSSVLWCLFLSAASSLPQGADRQPRRDRLQGHSHVPAAADRHSRRIQRRRRGRTARAHGPRLSASHTHRTLHPLPPLPLTAPPSPRLPGRRGVPHRRAAGCQELSPSALLPTHLQHARCTDRPSSPVLVLLPLV